MPILILIADVDSMNADPDDLVGDESDEMNTRMNPAYFYSIKVMV